MPGSNHFHAQLFPRLLFGIGTEAFGSASSTRYAESVYQSLEKIDRREGADIVARQEEDRGDGSTRAVDLEPLRRDLQKAWCRADKRLSQEILDGTVDGFPEL